jgi:hypothetical protein
MKRALAVLTLLALAVGCSDEKAPPLKLDGNKLVIRNDTDEEWKNVELWLNWYYRAVLPSIPAHGRVDATLDSFMEGYGRRFDYAHTMVKDLKLTARRANGETLELKLPFKDGDGLKDAVQGSK